MNEITTKKNIKNMIYEIRGKQVMLDSDLAELYNCKNGTKSINLAVRRHIKRFPERFMFQLTQDEYYKILRFQNETLELKQGKYSKYLPYAFTEQGVAMLSAVLKTDIAEEISVSIMDAFIEMRRFINENKDLFNRINRLEYDNFDNKNKLIEHDNKINQIIDEMNPKEIKEKIFYDGEIYDAYSLLINIIREAKNKIIIIDNYIDKTIFDILSYKDENIKVEIWTKEEKIKLDYDKFNLQYENVRIKKINSFHDRFIIIDNEKLYHVGASLKDLGKKCFAITKMNSKFIEKIISVN